MQRKIPDDMSTLTLTSPVMSDKTLLLSVEDLISIAMGPREGNIINFKVLQTILHILARQMRVLEQKVILVSSDVPGKKRRGRSRGRGRGGRDYTDDYEEGGFRRRTPPEFSTEEERLAWEREEDAILARHRHSQQKGRRSRDDEEYGGSGRSGGSHGRSTDDDYDRGRGRSGGRQSSDRDDDGRGRSGGHGGYDDDDRGGRARSGGRGGHDIDDSDDRGRDRSGRGGIEFEDSYDRGGHGRSGGRGGERDVDDSYDREGRDRSGGRGGRHTDDSQERGGSDRSGKRGGRDVDDSHDRSGGRGGQDFDERSGGHGRHDGDERGGHGRSGGRGGDRDDDREGSVRSGPGGHGRHDRDDDDGGRGRAGGRADDRYDEDRRSDRVGGKHGGRDDGYGRSGGRGGDRDDERGGHDRAGGGRGFDRDDDGRGRGGRDGTYGDDDRGRDRAEGRGRGGEDDRGRGGREGRDGDEYRGGAGGRGGRDDAGGRQGLGVREIEGPGKEKLLVVEKGPTTVGTARDRDSIAVVTQSQFQLLEEQVDELWRAAGPLPVPTMPDNKQLRQDLAAGASLTDAMQAMQVSARVQAAEQAIMKLGGLLTQLAASGALPEDAVGELMGGGWLGDEEMRLKSASSGTAYKSIRVEPSAKQLTRAGQAGQSSVLAGAKLSTSGKSSMMAAAQYITVPEMGTALGKLREDVTNTMESQIERATAAADSAEKTARAVGEKVEELLKIDGRLNNMYNLVEDYSDQLNGFDAGLSTQMASFKDQMTTLRAELETGLEQLEASNSNPETAAVMELNERFEGLVHGLDDTLLQHKTLNDMQHQLTEELKTLVEGVEVLREQKADRDELLDILRDKADISMLDGLVRQAEFDQAQVELEQRLEKCNDKFKVQDAVWMEAIKDLRDVSDTKAQLTDLMKVRDDATTQLRSIDDRINQLALLLGEPKAAMLMRKLARDAVCGACLAPALMEPGEAPAPPLLPPAYPRPPEPPCVPEVKAPEYPDFRTHHCRRWVGGSHTMLPAARAHPRPLELPDVTRKYTGYGEDGKLYFLESECVPCVECNPEPAPAPPATARAGAGDADGDYCPCYDENN